MSPEMLDLMDQFLGENGTIAHAIPGFEFRNQQVEMARVIFNAISRNQSICIEAGTGTGKSLAYLVPIALSRIQVIISTGTKNLQEQLYFNDVPILNRIIPEPLSAVMVKGRNNYLCLARWMEYLNSPGLFSRIESSSLEVLSKWVVTTLTGDISEITELSDYSMLWSEICSRSELCLGSRCNHFRACFVHKLKIRAEKADIVIVNHHLLLADMLMRRDKQRSILPDSTVIVFDEAHLLEDIVTDYLGVRLAVGDILDLMSHVTRQMADIKLTKSLRRKINASQKRVRDVAKVLFEKPVVPEQRFFLSSTTNHDQFCNAESLIEEMSFARDVFHSAVSPLTKEIFDEIESRFKDIEDRARFIFTTTEPEYVYWVENNQVNSIFHSHPIIIARDFSRLLTINGTNAVFTSATLSIHNDFSFFQNRLGLQHAQGYSYASPFNYRIQGMLYIPRHLPDPGNPAFYEMAADEAERLLHCSQGRAFILCTSYRGMFELNQRLSKKLPYRLLVQGSAPKHRLIEQFKSDVHSVLIATSSFWQGVDVPGEALSCVIIDKLPFSSPKDPIINARIEYITNRGGNAFNEFQLPSAIMQLKQGIGRLIRSRSDRGVVAILDSRIHTKRYGKSIVSSLPDFKIATEFESIQHFFANDDPN